MFVLTTLPSRCTPPYSFRIFSPASLAALHTPSPHHLLSPQSHRPCQPPAVPALPCLHMAVPLPAECLRWRQELLLCSSLRREFSPQLRRQSYSPLLSLPRAPLPLLPPPPCKATWFNRCNPREPVRRQFYNPPPSPPHPPSLPLPLPLLWFSHCSRRWHRSVGVA